MLLVQVELALCALSVFENCAPVSLNTAVGNAAKDQDPRVRAASTWILAGHALFQQLKKGKQSAPAWKVLSRLAAGKKSPCSQTSQKWWAVPIYQAWSSSCLLLDGNFSVGDLGKCPKVSSLLSM